MTLGEASALEPRDVVFGYVGTGVGSICRTVCRNTRVYVYFEDAFHPAHVQSSFMKGAVLVSCPVRRVRFE